MYQGIQAMLCSIYIFVLVLFQSLYLFNRLTNALVNSSQIQKGSITPIGAFSHLLEHRSMGAALRKADCDIRRVFKIVAAALHDAGDQGTGGEVLRARCLPVRVALAKSLWRTWRSLLPFGTWIRSPLATSRVLKEAICKRTIQCSVRTVDHEGFRDAADLVGCLLGLSDPDCAWLDSWIWMRADFTAKQCALDPDLEVDAEEQARAMQARECRLLCSSRHPSRLDQKRNFAATQSASHV